MDRLDFLAGEEHFVDHLAPIWLALPEHERGTFWITGKPTYERSVAKGIDGAQPVDNRYRHTQPVVVASYGDVKRARHYGNGGIALLQHGAGQSYGNDNPSYSGGSDHEDVGLFLTPNLQSSQRWAFRYPDADTIITGSPRVERLPKREGDLTPTVAFSFHWQCSTVPETMPAFLHHRVGIELAKAKFRVIGHAHPRARRWLEPWYKRYGIPFVRDFDDVCRQADIYVCDNSSTIFEFAATGRPVVLLNDPKYRRKVEFGLRFWEDATIGQQVDHPSALLEALSCGLLDPKGLREERERVVRRVYGIVNGSTEAAIAALRGWQA